MVSSVTPFDQTGTKTLVDHLQTALGRVGFPSDLQVHLAGVVATNVANQEQSNKQGNEIQLFSVLFILILLFVIFRSVLAPFVTLLGPLFALTLSGRFIGALGAHGSRSRSSPRSCSSSSCWEPGRTTACSWSSGSARSCWTAGARTRRWRTPWPGWGSPSPPRPPPWWWPY